MPDYDPRIVDPILLRLMRKPGQAVTPGARLIGDPFLMRQLQSMQPRIIGSSRVNNMPGANFARPGAGFMPPKVPDNVAQGEMMPDELGSLANHVGALNKPVPGGNIDPTKADRTPWMNANDKQNILQNRLDNMRATQRDDDWKYQMALMEQRDRIKSQQPVDTPAFKPPATITPLLPDIQPRKPLDTKQIYKAASNLEKQGFKDDASLARRYNFLTERFRDQIKDYQLAHTDLKKWTEKNAVPDPDKGLEDMERLNTFLKFSKQPELNFMDYKELKRYELQEKMRKQGADNFYADLKNNLTSMHGELDRIHKLIEQHSE